MPVKTARKEHTLSDDVFARVKLEALSREMQEWRSTTQTSRRAMADLVGCHQQQIANIEHCQNFPSAPVLWAIERVMSGAKP